MGEDQENKHKHHKKHSSSSSKKKKHKHKSEHKHKSSSSKKHRHRHKHGKSHKKHNKHKEKKRSDEVNLQTALENLEMLEDILKTSAEYSPDELMAQVLNEARAEGGLGEEDSNDSSSDSDASLDLGPGDKPRSPATSKAKNTAAVVGNTDELPSDGKGSSSVAILSEEAKAELESKQAPEPTAPVTKQTAAETETTSPTAKKEGENDDKNEVKGGKRLTISIDSTPPSQEKTVKVENKLSSSQAECSKSDLESTSDSEAESNEKATGGTRNSSGVFKPFSKKVKALGSKTEIKINIRQKEGDKTAQSKEGKVNDSKKSDSHRSSADSAKKESRRESESRRHKRSSRRSRTRSRSHSRSRSRSRSRTRHRRRHSRSHSRSPRQRRNRSRSRSYSRRSRRGRSHSRSRRRSRSRSYSRSRRRSRRSRSRSWRRSRSRSRSYSSTPPPSKRKKNSIKSKSEVKETPVEIKVDKKTEISQLTAFCKDLQAKQAHEDVHGETPQVTEPAQIHHPFAVNPNQPSSSFHQPSLIFHNNAWKTTSQLAIEAAVTDMAKPLVEKFPVSAGLQHTREEETATSSSNVFAQYQELSKMSVSDLVAKRTEIQKQILISPADVEVHKALNYIQQQTSMWAESKVTPGQYTGQQKITPLSKEAHNTGYQAWAKKRMFHGLAPVGDGFGMKMLKKMGWKEGQPIGKQGEGHVEPICLDVKMDRFGLTTESDYSKGGSVQPASVLRGTKADMKTASLVQDKHPVSALQELCARKRWDPPCYTIKEDAGPAHLKMFLYQVTIPLGTFQPAVGSNSKKLAKMQAATAALQGLGLLEKTIEYITL